AGERRLGETDQASILRTVQPRPCFGRVLVVALRVQLEVRGRRRFGRETVVPNEPAELRRRDRRLTGLDRVEDRSGAELVLSRRPRRGAAARLRRRLVPAAVAERRCGVLLQLG